MNDIGTIEYLATRTRAAGDCVLRFITAGSVDDGKSTLIGRLLHDSRALAEDQLGAVTRASSRRGGGELDLSLLTDGLEAEREQGITIDVAYRHFATARRRFIIADTPGHEQYTRNMVTGASTADAAVILIDARKGVLSQTRRHATIAHLLGVRHLIVAVNKMDLVDYRKAVFDRIGDEFNGFAGELGVTSARLIPVSALCADMIVERGERIGWYRGPTVLQALESIESGGHHAHSALRLPVQVLVRPSSNGDFRGYAGRIESGVLMQGAEVIALPSGRSTFVRDIVSLEGSRSVAAAGESVTVLLRDELDISRGDMLADAAFPPRITRNVDATVCWLANEPLQPNARLLLKHTTRSTRAKLRSLNYRVDIHTLERHRAPPTLAMNDIAHLSLTLQQPIFCDPYAVNRATGAFILIDEASNATVAAGLIE